LSAVVLAGLPSGRGSRAAQPDAASQPPRPTFRLEANYVRVDVYPTREGQPVQDLTREDFELFEDGAVQKILQFERISLAPAADRSTRRDPRSVADALEQAADPRRRIFVVFLDTGMSTLEASHDSRRPIVNMLDRLIGADDLYAVMTPDMSAAAITFARRTESLDADLARYWTWGQRDALARRDPEELEIETCFPDPAPEKYCTDYRGKLIVQPPDAYRGVAAQLIERRNEKRALDALSDLVGVLGAVREERKAVIVVTQGWRLLEPKPELTRMQECDRPPDAGRIGVGPTGRIERDVAAARDDPSQPATQCHQLAIAYASTDNFQRFRDLIERANRFNVSFYPFDARGLAVFDRSIGARDDRIRNDPGERSPRIDSRPGPIGDMGRLKNRIESLQSLASATDGLAVVNTNDLMAGAQRIVNDLSTYYLIGYQSTNTKADGRWRDISVRVSKPGIRVRARKGYRALTEAEAAALRPSGAPAARSASPANAASEATDGVTPAALAAVLGPLASLERPLPWRSRAAWRIDDAIEGAPRRGRFWIASELEGETLRQFSSSGGGTLALTMALGDGATIATRSVTLEPGAGATESLIEAPIPRESEIVIRLRLVPAGGGLPVTDTLRLSPGSRASPRLFRSGPTTGNRFVAAGSQRFLRRERVRVAVSLEDAGATVEAGLLDRTGATMRIPVASRVETLDGVPWAIGEVSLAPLSPGEYVVQLVVRKGETAARTLTGIRVVN
jgi:VWFA-related protein